MVAATADCEASALCCAVSIDGYRSLDVRVDRLASGWVRELLARTEGVAWDERRTFLLCEFGVRGAPDLLAELERRIAEWCLSRVSG